MLTFSLDDNYGWDDGLICGGRMSILAVPLTRSQRSEVRGQEILLAEYYRRLRELVETGHGCTEAIIVTGSIEEKPVGSRYLFDAGGHSVAQTVPGAVPASVIQQLVSVQERPRPFLRGGIAYLPILPRITLLIVGGGHVGQGVARLAPRSISMCWVLDDRERYVSPDRFPTAKRLLAGDIGRTLKELRGEIGPSVYAIIVTRGHGHDEEALYQLAETSAGYIGMIGSKRKIKLIHDDLIGRNVPEEALSRVHAPLGFAIGSQTVPEIAISIVAELIARRNLGRTEQVHHKDAKVRLG